MLKQAILGVAVAATFVGSAVANDVVMGDPYWAQLNNKKSEVTTAQVRESGVQIIKEQHAAEDSLERAGFPQYGN